jgi:LmbE family N-acetylglucosaminyl deacetylase
LSLSANARTRVHCTYMTISSSVQHQLTALGTVAFVGAHPDDETFVAGGLLAACARLGQAVGVLTATRGEAGVRDPVRWPPARLGKIREWEQHEALKMLGVYEQSNLGYADGGCADVSPRTAKSQVGRWLDKLGAETVVTFGPEGLTGHSDHQSVSGWARAAAGERRVLQAVYLPVQQADMERIDRIHDVFFAIEQPPVVAAEACDLVFELPLELLELKRLALGAMPSQYEAMMPDLAPEGILCGGLSIEAFTRG